MDNNVLLLSDTSDCGCDIGGSDMARARYSKTFNPRLGRYVKKRSRGRRRSMSNIGDVGAIGIKSAFASVKDVLMTGAIATAGAVITDKVWTLIGGKLNLDRTSKALAQMATGIGLGIVIGKFAKRPALGVAFAIGPVVKGFLDLLGGVLGTPTAGIRGIRGVTSVDMPGIKPASASLPFQGLPQVGQGVPTELVKYPEMAMI